MKNLECYKIQKGKSLVRLFNVLPGNHNIDIYIGGGLVFEDLKYKESSLYIYLVENIYLIEIYKRGTKDLIISNLLPLPKDDVFTLAITDNLGQASITFLEDSLDIKSLRYEVVVKVANLSPNLPSVKLMYSNNYCINNIEYEEVTSYLYLQPGKYKVIIEDVKTGTFIIEQELEFKMTEIYTLFIIQNDMNDFQIIQLLDENTYLCR